MTLTNFGTANTAEEEDCWIFSSDIAAVSNFVHFIKVGNNRLFYPLSSSSEVLLTSGLHSTIVCLDSWTHSCLRHYVADSCVDATGVEKFHLSQAKLPARPGAPQHNIAATS